MYSHCDIHRIIHRIMCVNRQNKPITFVFGWAERDVNIIFIFECVTRSNTLLADIDLNTYDWFIIHRLGYVLALEL